ncbi:MAG: hypothetical protein QRY74_00965 [Chlamydia sp.]
MGQIDYSKAEETIEKALQNMHKKQLEKGLAIHSKWAAQYYGKQNTPAPEDPVESIFTEEAEENSSEVEEDSYDELSQVIDTTPSSESISLTPSRKASKTLVSENSTAGLAEISPTSPLLELRNHILWFKIRGFKDRYEQIGTTLEEVMKFRRKSHLSEEDLKRIQGLNVRSHQFRKTILERELSESDENLIEQQKKEHKNRLHSVRDRWLKL